MGRVITKIRFTDADNVGIQDIIHQQNFIFPLELLVIVN